MGNEATVAAVICAAGDSKRMGGVKKEYRPLPGSNLTVLGAAVSAFAEVPAIRTIVIAVPNDPETGEAAARNALPPEFLAEKNRPSIHFVPGGTTRRDSVFNALNMLTACGNPPGYVLIHDGARPWVSPGLIGRLIEEVKKHGAVIPLLPLTETPKEIDREWGVGNGEWGYSSLSMRKNNMHSIQTTTPLPTPYSPLPTIKRHLRRALVGVAQTPQAFAFAEILAAHKKAALRAKAGETEYTDDAEVWASFCGPGPVAAIPGDPENRKITFPEDL